MAESAITLRELKREETSRRITLQARELTAAEGLDGFTMDELAAAAGVSRRTLFNYFPSKTDAVLGEPPALPDDAVATFRSGGPTGGLVDDLAELARPALGERHLDRATLAQLRRLLAREPRLLAAIHERFEAMTQEFTELVVEREGPQFDRYRARLLLQIVLTLLDVAVDALVNDPTHRSLVEIFDEQLATARELLT